ncbi:MAG: Ribosomal RNA small subunit methyltransferase E (EC [uncultured Campylobacterales bacterium]|uniref:Ribosomal RNA small subunit methyltransferase E n=1 Tax=uncultured Campylobacterales bacterium TaxID=352960 RepID=A0A6S6SZN2_9BACT|nr:MAG: Ribosomal RNA small subunit methyltransferase E (EC [uncultured Campylobacterales bacterium]
MKFLYHEEAGNEDVIVSGEKLSHLKVRRVFLNDTLLLRNLKDAKEYVYIITHISKKEISLSLDCKLPLEEENKKLHIYWSIIDPKEIEKTLPLLNEIGVSDITFFYASRSQRNFKLNLDKLNKILISSSQQCGRNSIINIDFSDSIDSIIDEDFVVIDFSEQKLSFEVSNIHSVLVGPEGGFTDVERELLKNKTTLGLNTNNILRSRTTVVCVSSKILL